jgi:hypothetical protein
VPKRIATTPEETRRMAGAKLRRELRQELAQRYQQIRQASSAK